MWTHRILLEATCHAVSSFVTLTFDDERFAGPGGGPRDLSVRDVQLWLKRLRKAHSGDAIRYFAVGEYGDRTGRPHYHAALFGYPSCAFGGFGIVSGECPCPACSGVRKSWGFGHVLVGALEIRSAQYIAGYVVKRMNSAGNPLLKGRAPEFARMSLMPGIGANAMGAVSCALLKTDRGLPSVLRMGDGPLRPLGRYLRKKISEQTGLEGAKDFGAEELRLVREYAFLVDKSVASVFREITGEETPYAAKGTL